MRGFNSTGVETIAQTQVNSSQNPNSSSFPSIAALAGGNFVVAWISSSTANIYMRGFNATGTETIAQMQADSSQSPNYLSGPSITGLSGGSFVVSWISNSNNNVYMRGFNASGAETFAQTQANSSGSITATTIPSSAGLTGGSFVVSWTATNTNVYVRGFDSSGTQTFAQTQVNVDLTSQTDYSPCVAALSKGSFIVAWNYKNSEQWHCDVYARCFDAYGTETITQSLINSPTHGSGFEATRPSATGLTDGSGVVTWIYNSGTEYTCSVHFREINLNPTLNFNVTGTPILTLSETTLSLNGSTNITGTTSINTTGTLNTNLGNASSALYSLSVLNNTGSGTTVDVMGTTGQLVAHSSSRRFKNNIQPLDDYGPTIAQLNPVSFNYKNDTHKTKQIGLIAEEVEQVIPELVVRDKDGLPFSVKYSDLTTLLLYELQKQQKTITTLSKEIADLKGHPK